MKKIGDPIAWIIRAFSGYVVAMPIPIVAPQSAQPIKAWIRILKNFSGVMIFLRFQRLRREADRQWIPPVLRWNSVVKSGRTQNGGRQKKDTEGDCKENSRCSVGGNVASQGDARQKT